MNDVQLIVNGTAYSGWKSVDIQRSIEQISGSFEVSVSEVAADNQAATELRPGNKVTVKVDNATVITGYIDDLEINHSTTEHTMTVRGRDVTADLVDSSAQYQSGEWNEKGMLDIVKDLVSPYNIKVSSNTDLGKPFEQWNLETGETIFENIDKLARHRGVLVVSDGMGGIKLTQPGTTRISTALKLGENILTGTLSLSYKQRFKTYIVLGQHQRNDNSYDSFITAVKGTATDAAVQRARTLITNYEDANADTDSLTLRANWQRNVNAAKAQRVTINVQGWSHAQGLWTPNVLVSVTDACLRLKNATLLIASVHFKLDMQGTRTELELAPRNAFLVDQIPANLLDAE